MSKLVCIICSQEDKKILNFKYIVNIDETESIKALVFLID